jgi:hypothetical protein
MCSLSQVSGIGILLAAGHCQLGFWALSISTSLRLTQPLKDSSNLSYNQPHTPIDSPILLTSLLRLHTNFHEPRTIPSGRKVCVGGGFWTSLLALVQNKGLGFWFRLGPSWTKMKWVKNSSQASQTHIDWRLDQRHQLWQWVCKIINKLKNFQSNFCLFPNFLKTATEFSCGSE